MIAQSSRVGVSVFEIANLTAAIEQSPVDNHPFEGNVLHRFEQQTNVAERRLPPAVDVNNQHN